MHNTHLESITNLLAAAVSLTKHYYPNLYPDIEINKRTLIERSIDDAFSDLTVPWADDPEFINQLDSLILELEPKIQTEVKDYMDQAINFMRNQIAEPEYHFNPTPASSHRGFLSTATSLLENQDGRARKIFLKTFKEPTDQHWSMLELIRGYETFWRKRHSRCHRVCFPYRRIIWNRRIYIASSAERALQKLPTWKFFIDIWQIILSFDLKLLLDLIREWLAFEYGEVVKQSS